MICFWEASNKLYHICFRMLAVLRFLFFNVALSATDVGTDFSTFLELLVDNPRWACLTLLWTVMPFLVRTAIFVFKRATGKCEACANCTELMGEFYKEAGCHLPFVSSLHNIWRAKRLHQLKFGTKEFQMKDHKEVEELLDEAGRCSQGESNYEAGPQSVTQVAEKSFHKINDRISTAGHRVKHWSSQHDPDGLPLHLPIVAFLGSFQVSSLFHKIISSTLSHVIPPGLT